MCLSHLSNPVPLLVCCRLNIGTADDKPIVAFLKSYTADGVCCNPRTPIHWSILCFFGDGTLSLNFIVRVIYRRSPETKKLHEESMFGSSCSILFIPFQHSSGRPNGELLLVFLGNCSCCEACVQESSKFNPSRSHLLAVSGPDTLRPAYVEELGRLTDRVAPFPKEAPTWVGSSEFDTMI